MLGPGHMTQMPAMLILDNIKLNKPTFDSNIRVVFVDCCADGLNRTKGYMYTFWPIGIMGIDIFGIDIKAYTFGFGEIHSSNTHVMNVVG